MTYDKKLRQTIRNIVSAIENVPSTTAEKEKFIYDSLRSAGVCKAEESSKDEDNEYSKE